MDTIIAFIMAIISFFTGGGEVVQETTVPEVPVMAEVVKVVDGDTIVVEMDGKEEFVRYIGIDTPEPYRDDEPACFSLEASLRNRELVAGKEVRLVADVENTDKYNRLLRYVYVDDIFVNEELVREGYAKSLTIPPNTAFKQDFIALEEAAREQDLGLWAACE